MIGRIALTNKLVSKSLGIEEKRVNGVMSFFFEELEKEFVECRHPFVFVKGLGTFGLTLSSVEKRIKDLRKRVQNQRSYEARGIIYPKRLKMVEGMVRETFFLFEVRRMLKKHRAECKKLKDYGKSLNDNQRELVSPDRKE